MHTFYQNRKSFFSTGFFLLLLSAPSMWATVLSDNLSAVTSYQEILDPTTWIAASFHTDNSAYTLSSVTVLLMEDEAGSVSLSLYSSDSNNQPGQVLGILTNPSSFNAGLAPTTFGGNSLTLAANQSYWVVLSVMGTGQYEWAYTEDNEGTGTGFNHTWGVTLDQGVNWFTSDQEPMQMQVVTQPTITSEPSAAHLLLFGLGGASLFLFTKRRSERNKTVSGFMKG